jgi:hypothetical protein
MNQLKCHQTSQNQAEPAENTTKLAKKTSEPAEIYCTGQNTPAEKERKRPARVNTMGVNGQNNAENYQTSQTIA